MKVNNPVAYDLSYRAVNLQSGHERTEEEIDYICAHIKSILGCQVTKVNPVQPTGWLAYRDKIEAILFHCKYSNQNRQDENDFWIWIKNKKQVLGKLYPITINSVTNDKEIELLTEWRRSAQSYFPTQFSVSLAGTTTWLEKQLLQKNDRILFMVKNLDNVPIGHIGLFRFNYQKRFCELDNIIRGNNNLFPGAMTYACNSLLDWAFTTLAVSTIYLRVVSDNIPALKLYQRLGFKEIQRIPLIKIAENNDTRWIELIGNPYYEVQRYSITMKLEKAEWLG